MTDLASPTPYPASADAPFAADTAESVSELTASLLALTREAAALTRSPARLAEVIACPSHAGKPTRHMTVEAQLISMAAHNSYHFGRIVLLRQLLGTWPPPSGGFTW